MKGIKNFILIILILCFLKPVKNFTGSIFDLIGLEANCPKSAIASFDYTFDNSMSLKLTFTCVPPVDVIFIDENDTYTTNFENINGDILTSFDQLKKLPIVCKTDYLLQRFSLIRGNFNSIAYSYTCVGAKVDKCNVVTSSSNYCAFFNLICLVNNNFNIPPNVAITAIKESNSKDFFKISNKMNWEIRYCTLRDLNKDINIYLNSVVRNIDYIPARKAFKVDIMNEEEIDENKEKRDPNVLVFKSEYVSVANNAPSEDY